MSKKTVVNDNYKGLVESMPIPAEVRERDGVKFAKFGNVVPIHCCTADEIAEYAEKTHHYCDLFTEEVLAPLEELAFVRIDENTAEKVFINRTKRIMITSSDGRLASWRCAPTFESANQFIAGAPIVNKEGALISLVTAKRGNHYAVTGFEGEGGYIETALPWKTLDIPANSLIYGDKSFQTRDQLRQYIATLPQGNNPGNTEVAPVLWRSGTGAGRIALVTGGRQLAHYYVHNVATSGVQYL